MEMIEVSEEPPQVPYSSLAPREYRKLHALHSSVQKDKDKSIRMPNQKPQFSYDGNTQPELPFLKRKPPNSEEFGYGDLSDDDFPTAAELADMAGSARKSSNYEKPASSGQSKQTDSIFDDEDESYQEMEALAAELDEDPMSHVTTPAPRASFANRLFDFDACDENVDETGGGSAPTSSSKMSTKEAETPDANYVEPTRETTLEHDIEEVQHRRISQAEQIQESATGSSFPSWVNEFDADLIDQFKDYVDFID